MTLIPAASAAVVAPIAANKPIIAWAMALKIFNTFDLVISQI